MQSSAPTAVDLAEKYEYAALVRAVQLRPELAQEVDDFGMTPLHWVCSDPRVPPRALQKLVLAHPRATATPNLAGLLPLHIALRKNLPLDALKLLLKFYPKAVVAPTPDGRTPLELANEHVTAPSARLFLQMLDAEVRALGRAASASKRQQKHQQLRDACEAPPAAPKLRANSRARLPPPSPTTTTTMLLPSFKENARDAGNVSELQLRQQNAPPSPAAAYCDPITECLNSPSMRAAAAPQRAPAWKLSKRCHVCDCKFGYFKSRHHCRNCGESVCGRHSRDSLPLRHIGLFHPQRVCAVCHEHLQNARVGCNTNESSSRRRADSGASSRYSLSQEEQEAADRSSTFWTPEALSPRIFRVPPPPKRSRSVRDYLLASPRRRAHHHGSSSDVLETTSSCGSVASPTATRSVRSESLQRNYSHATLASLPMFPSAASMFLSRVQMAPATSHLVQAHRKELERQSRREEAKQQANDASDDDGDGGADARRNAYGSARSHRRLAKTELDAPSKAWYEELDQLPHAPGQKLSMDSRVSELEEHVQKLLVAKKQIGEALRKSQLQIHLARAEKDKYDAIAQKYLDEGFAPCSPPPSPPLQSLVRRVGDLELAEALGCADPTEKSDDSGRQEPVGSSCTASTTASSRETQSRESDFDRRRSTLSEDEERASPSARPSSPLPAPRLSPFRSEKLELHIPLDVAATHHELGVVLLGKCDFASAAAEFRKALEIDADNAVAWFHLAKALDGAGELPAAELAVNQSLALDAASLPSLSLLGRLLHLRGEHDEAIVVFRKALNLQCPPASLAENNDDGDRDDDEDDDVASFGAESR